MGDKLGDLISDFVSFDGPQARLYLAATELLNYKNASTEEKRRISAALPQAFPRCLECPKLRQYIIRLAQKVGHKPTFLNSLKKISLNPIKLAVIALEAYIACPGEVTDMTFLFPHLARVYDLSIIWQRKAVRVLRRLWNDPAALKIGQEFVLSREDAPDVVIQTIPIEPSSGFVDHYIKTILESKGEKRRETLEAWSMAAKKFVTADFFEKKIFPAITRMLKRQPEFAARATCFLLSHSSLDMSPFLKDFIAATLDLFKSSRKDDAPVLLRHVTRRCFKLDSVTPILEQWGQSLSKPATNAAEKGFIMQMVHITMQNVPDLKELPQPLLDAVLKEINVGAGADKSIPVAIVSKAARTSGTVPQPLLDAFAKILADKKDNHKPPVVEALVTLNAPKEWIEKHVMPLIVIAVTKPGLRQLSIHAWLACMKAKVPMKKDHLALLKDNKSIFNSYQRILAAPRSELMSQAHLLKEIFATVVWEERTTSSNEVDFTLGSNSVLCRALLTTIIALHNKNTVAREDAPHETEPIRQTDSINLLELLKSMPPPDAKKSTHELVIGLWDLLPIALEEKCCVGVLRSGFLEIIEAVSGFLSPHGAGMCQVLLHHEVFTSNKWPVGRVWATKGKHVPGMNKYTKLIVLKAMREPAGPSEKIYRNASLNVVGSMDDNMAIDEIIGDAVQVLTEGSTQVIKDSSTNAVHYFFAPEGKLWVPEGLYTAKEVESSNVKVDKIQRELYGDDIPMAKQPKQKAKPKAKGKEKPGASKDMGNLTAAEIEEIRIQEQSEKRAKMRAYLDTIDFALDILGILGNKNHVERLTKWTGPLMPIFVELFKSPLTSLRTGYRLRPFVGCVVKKESIGSRSLIPDVLQTFSQRGPEEGEALACTLLNSISPLSPLNAAALSLLAPVFTMTLKTGTPKLSQACEQCLDVLTTQLPLIYRECLDQLTSNIRLDIIEGVFCVLYRLPQLLHQAVDCLSVINTHLISSNIELERLSSFPLQLDGKVRKAILPTLKELLKNEILNRDDSSIDDWPGKFHPALIISAVEDPKIKEDIMDEFNLISNATVLPGILRILKNEIPGPVKDLKEVQLLASKALAQLVVELDNKNFSQQVMDSLHKAYIEVEDRHGLARGFEQIFKVENVGAFAKTNLHFLVDKALSIQPCDPEERDSLINSGLGLMEYHGDEFNGELLAVLESFDPKKFTENQHLASAVFYGGLAKHLDSGDPKVSAILPRLLDRLLNKDSTLSVQVAIVKVLPPLVKQATGQHEQVMNDMLEKALNSKDETTRRGAAFGLGAAVKGISVQSLKQHGIMQKIEEVVNNTKNSATQRQGAIMCIEGLTRSLGRLFEPYVISSLPTLLQAYSDSSEVVRTATASAASSIMAQLSGHGVKLVLPSLLKGVEEKQWRTKLASIELLASMVNCAPKQLASCLPAVVPALTNVLNDMHPKVKTAARESLEMVASVITNPEIKALSKDLLIALQFSSDDQLKKVLDALLNTSFVHNVDAPSLALVCPLVNRALKDRSAETKRKGAQIVGSMILLIKEPKDIAPYLPSLLPALKDALIDPIPDVRATSAKAFGTVAQGLPEEYLDDLIPWLFETLKSKESEVERSGAAHGLSEVLMAIGMDRIEEYLPDIIATATSPSAPPEIKEGYLGLFVYLPTTLGAKNFEPYFIRVVNALLSALSDDAQSVRDIAYRAGSGLAKQFGASHTALMLPPLEEGIFHADWRVRLGCVQLLGLLIEQIFKATRMNLNSGDLMSCEVLPHERRAFMLSSLYIVRSDWHATVRQTTTSVWKQVVQNTPRTLKELLPILMTRLIANLASPVKEKQVVAARCVGDLVGKLGDRVLPELMPSFMKNLQSGDTNTREGVCIGLTEVINSTTKQLLVEYINELVPAVQKALLDEVPEIRNSASGVIALLYNKVGASATRPIVLWILEGLATDDSSFIEGLEQLLARQPQMCLPIVLEHLPACGPDWTQNQLFGFGAISKVPDIHTLHRHLGEIMPPLLHAAAGEHRESALIAAANVMQKIDEGGAHLMLAELTTSIRSSDADAREAGATMFNVYFKESPAPMVQMLSTTLNALVPAALGDADERVLKASVEALSTLIKACAKDDIGPYLPTVRQLVLEQAFDRSRREIKGKILPGLAKANAIDPLYPIYQHGLMFGSTDMRAEAAKALGELVDHITEEALKPYVVKITGPLIRIVGDRFSSEVKIAIMHTLRLLLYKGGAALRPFLPQLQTTYNKCLSDPTVEVRTKAAESLGTLVQLSKGNRVEPLLADLCLGSDIETVKALEDKSGVRAASCLALQNILENMPVPVPEATAEKVWASCKAAAFSGDPEDPHASEVRESAGSALGVLMRWNKALAGEIKPYLSTSESLENRQAAVAAFSNSSPEIVELATLVPFIGQDEPIKSLAIRALGTFASPEAAKKLNAGLSMWKTERSLIAALTAVGRQDPKDPSSAQLIQTASSFLAVTKDSIATVREAAQRGIAELLGRGDADPETILKNFQPDSAVAIRALIAKKE